MKINETLINDNQQRLAELETRLGYRFREPGRLLTALIHSSFAFEQGKNTLQDNEILEFLGDAVLDLVLGNALSRAFPAAREGELTRMRAGLVNEASLADRARDLALGEYLFLGKGEAASGGRDKSSLLSCVYEAVVGAIFQDGGYQAVAAVVEGHFIPQFSKGRQAMLRNDAKSALQELTQKLYGAAPVYGLEKAVGPDHNKQFTASVRLGDRVLAVATAGSKKEAEQRAAGLALVEFGAPGSVNGQGQNSAAGGR